MSDSTEVRDVAGLVVFEDPMTFRVCTSFLILAALASISSASVNFSNFSSNGAATSAGFNSPVVGSNSLTYQPSSAYVVGSTTPVTYEFAYDATDAQSAIGGVTGLTQAFVGGTGTASYTLSVFNLAGGGLLGTQTVNAASSPSSLASVSFAGVSGVHVVSSITLTAPANFDFAAVAQTNETIKAVPEPASLAALGLGFVGLARRRRKS